VVDNTDYRGEGDDMTPTQRSLAKLRAEGYSACVVEKWVPNSPAGFKGPLITRDAWNFGDILAVKVGIAGATLVQTTSGSNVSARIAKIRSIAEAGIWLAAGNSIVAHGWRKVGPRGKRKVWECREVPVTDISQDAPRTL
jgi:hypothetical protein